MPTEYEKVRDAIYRRMIAKGISAKHARKQARKIAAIWYFKKYHRPVRHED